MPSRSNKNPSIKQLAYRAKFKLLQEWRSNYTDLFAITFKNHTYKHSAQNAAHHFNVQIITGEYPNFSIDRSMILISKGNLPMPSNLEMNLTDNNMLNFTWNGKAESGSKPHDLAAIVVIYDSDNWYQVDLAAGKRDGGKCNFQLNNSSEYSTADVFFTMLSNDRERAADSVYMGRFDLMPPISE
jgi:hypothetical protein